MKGFKDYIQEAPQEAAFTFGEFNPPTTGHEKLIGTVAKVAGSSKYFIYVSQSNDPKKNPLDYKSKVKFIRKMFPKAARNIILDTKIRNVFDIMTSLYSKGFTKVTMVVGSDRVSSFDALLGKYNGVEGKHGMYKFDSISVVSAGDRDPDADDVSGMSASKMRAAAADNNFETFTRGLPSGFKYAKELFNAVRTGMGLSESHAFRQHVELKSISEEREAYVSGKLLAEGDVVEYENTIGQVIFLGSNYIIVESADGVRSRKWITDVKLIEAKDKDTDQPKKYMSGIKSKSTKMARDKHFEKGAKMDDDDPDAYKPAPGDATAKTKPSKYTKKYKKMFDENVSSFEDVLKEDTAKALKSKAEKSGISYGILKKVFDRGVAAWRTGHRPGTTPTQWGLARVNSFIVGGKTRKTTDADLWKTHKS
jgi:hypothetical protein